MRCDFNGISKKTKNAIVPGVLYGQMENHVFIMLRRHGHKQSAMA